MSEKNGRAIGLFLRLLSGAIAFGVWQQSLAGGVFVFFALACLDVKVVTREIKGDE